MCVELLAALSEAALKLDDTLQINILCHFWKLWLVWKSSELWVNVTNLSCLLRMLLHDEEQKRKPRRSHFIYCSQNQAFNVLTVFSGNKVRLCYITKPTWITHVTCVYFTHSLDFSSEKTTSPSHCRFLERTLVLFHLFIGSFLCLLCFCAAEVKWKWNMQKDI